MNPNFTKFVKEDLDKSQNYFIKNRQQVQTPILFSWQVSYATITWMRMMPR